MSFGLLEELDIRELRHYFLKSMLKLNFTETSVFLA